MNNCVNNSDDRHTCKRFNKGKPLYHSSFAVKGQGWGMLGCVSVCQCKCVCVCVCVCVRESVGSSETVNTAVLNKFVHYNVFMSSASHMMYHRGISAR